LSTMRYLTGSMISEADWRLFTTLVRSDPLYVGHFKCAIRRMADYEHLPGYIRDLYQQPNVAATVNMQNIENHYYASHESINPSRVVPTGPEFDFTLPYSRTLITLCGRPFHAKRIHRRFNSGIASEYASSKREGKFFRGISVFRNA